MAKADGVKPRNGNAGLFYRELLKARRLALSAGFGTKRDKARRDASLEQATLLRQPALARVTRSSGMHE